MEILSSLHYSVHIHALPEEVYFIIADFSK